MTQTQLAEATGLTQMYVSRRCRKSTPTPMDLEDLVLFCRALRCSIEDLLPKAGAYMPPPAAPAVGRRRSSVATLKYARPLQAVA